MEKNKVKKIKKNKEFKKMKRPVHSLRLNWNHVQTQTQTDINYKNTHTISTTIDIIHV